MSGKAKGEGPFAVFAGTYRYVLDTQFVDINVKIDGRKSSFSIPRVMDVQLESFKNPGQAKSRIPRSSCQPALSGSWPMRQSQK
jgi:hypothetical protein